jgi:hypothetical protein
MQASLSTTTTRWGQTSGAGWTLPSRPHWMGKTP